MMTQIKKQMVLFTDLDGSLLDRKTYRWEPAGAMVERIVEEGIPLVFCSSKTLVEQRHYQAALGIEAPLIIENGSAIVLPRRIFPVAPAGAKEEAADWLIEFGATLEEIRDRLDSIRHTKGISFAGLSTLTEEEVGYWTGLRGVDAQRAQQRRYSETIVSPLSEEDLAQLRDGLTPFGLSIVQGTRFSTVTSRQTHKGRAVHFVSELYRGIFGSLFTVAGGDGRNDLPMLRAVDHGILLRGPGTDWCDEEVAGLHLVEGEGPAAWCRAVAPLLPHFP
ncbi:MAG: HAD-IIB family hydrolase [Blastocatellia bacterium]